MGVFNENEDRKQVENENTKYSPKKKQVRTSGGVQNEVREKREKTRKGQPKWRILNKKSGFDSFNKINEWDKNIWEFMGNH